MFLLAGLLTTGGWTETGSSSQVARDRDCPTRVASTHTGTRYYTPQTEHSMAMMADFSTFMFFAISLLLFNQHILKTSLNLDYLLFVERIKRNCFDTDV